MSTFRFVQTHVRSSAFLFTFQALNIHLILLIPCAPLRASENITMCENPNLNQWNYSQYSVPSQLAFPVFTRRFVSWRRPRATVLCSVCSGGVHGFPPTNIAYSHQFELSAAQLFALGLFCDCYLFHQRFVSGSSTFCVLLPLSANNIFTASPAVFILRTIATFLVFSQHGWQPTLFRLHGFVFLR